MNASKTTIGAIGEILNDFKEMLGNEIVEAYGYNTIQYSLDTQETGLNVYSLERYKFRRGFVTKNDLSKKDAC